VGDVGGEGRGEGIPKIPSLQTEERYSAFGTGMLKTIKKN
jgi:hypothetical protein